MDLCIVGAGEMGRWLADLLPADVAVAVADEDPDVAAAAAADLDARAVPVGTDERFDAVVLAVPMPAVSRAVADWAANAERAMLDVSGSMADPVEAMREHLPDRERASLHPLFAPPRAPGNVPVVVDRGGPVVDQVLAAVESAGNTVFETTVDEHDRAMETVQARTHAAILAFALSAREVPGEFHTPVSAELWELARTVTEGSPHVYADIQRTFDGADDLARAARRVADADLDGTGDDDTGLDGAADDDTGLDSGGVAGADPATEGSRESFRALYEAARETVGADSRAGPSADDADGSDEHSSKPGGDRGAGS